MASSQTNSWIFISHASADLPVVRGIRNYLEEQGASPLLFHLLALKDPEDFWPIIQKEIEARNFFLYCDSPAAQASDWVRREIAAVERLRAYKPVRVERIDVSSGVADMDALDDLVRKTRVYVHHNVPWSGMVEPYVTFLSGAGFDVQDISPRKILSGDVLADGVSVDEMLKKRFIVHFAWSGGDAIVSPMDDALMSVRDETIIVFLDEPPDDHPGLEARRVVRAWEDRRNAPNALLSLMMHE